MRLAVAGAGRHRLQLGEPAAGWLAEIHVLMSRHQAEARAGTDTALMLAGQKAGAQRTVGHDGDVPSRAEAAELETDITHGQIVFVLQDAKRFEPKVSLQRHGYGELRQIVIADSK